MICWVKVARSCLARLQVDEILPQPDKKKERNITTEITNKKIQMEEKVHRDFSKKKKL